MVAHPGIPLTTGQIELGRIRKALYLRRVSVPNSMNLHRLKGKGGLVGGLFEC
jgi:hypothetical protein